MVKILDLITPEGRQEIRSRPAMYWGTAQHEGPEGMLYELVSNVLDLWLVGQATEVRIELDGCWIIVRDDGPGFHAIRPGEVPAALHTFHRTPTADGHAPHVHACELGGLGVSSAALFAAEFELETWVDGERRTYRALGGEPGAPTESCTDAEGRGTRIRLRPDPEIFGDHRVRVAVLRAVLFEAVHLYPGFTAHLGDEVFRAEGGLADYAAHRALHTGPRSFPQTRGFGQRWSTRKRVGDIEVDVALLGDLGSSERQTDTLTWVNGARTWQGGHHLQGLQRARREVHLRPVVELVHVLMHAPKYAGPTRGRLNNPEVEDVVYDLVRSLLSNPAL